MTGECLRFYVEENQRHQGVLVWEWLLERANAMGLHGGTAFRAVGGFGRHHALHESQFFELAGSTAVEVEFIVDAGEVQRLMGLVRDENLRLFYVRHAVHFSVINADADELSATASGEGKH
jgi:uncharacterized protein